MKGGNKLVSGIERTPLRIATYSGRDEITNSVEKFVQYDYNYAAGWVVIADYPKIISQLSMTTTIGQNVLPKASFREVDETYDVYIDIQSQLVTLFFNSFNQDYEYGGTFILEMNQNNFKWTGECESIYQVCIFESTDCVEIPKLKAEEQYICTVESSFLKFQQLTAISTKSILRIHTKVQNAQTVV